MAPPLNHSTIAKRTRGRLKTHARNPDTNPKGDLSLKQDPKEPKTARPTVVPEDDDPNRGRTNTDTPQTTTPALIDVSLGPQFRQNHDNLLSSTRIKPDDSEADD